MVPVDDHHLATGDIREAVAKPDDRGYFECPGQDGRVAGVASDFRGEPHHELPIEIGSLAGCQVVCQHDDRSRQVDQFLTTFSEQVPENSFFEIKDVDGSFGVVLVSQVLEFAGEPAEHSTGSKFGREALFADESLDFRDQFRIAGHLQVRTKNGAELVAELIPSQLLVLFNFLPDHLERVAKTAEFTFDRIDGDEAIGNPEVLGPQHEDLACDDTGRDGDPALDLHQAPTFPRASDPTRHPAASRRQGHQNWTRRAVQAL